MPSKNRSQDFEYAHVLLDAANMLTSWGENNGNRNHHGEDAVEQGRRLLKLHNDMLRQHEEQE
jgi:hypothetical protein